MSMKKILTISHKCKIKVMHDNEDNAFPNVSNKEKVSAGADKEFGKSQGHASELAFIFCYIHASSISFNLSPGYFKRKLVKMRVI